MLARVVVVEPGARARVRDADGDQLVVLSDVRGVSHVCSLGSMGILQYGSACPKQGEWVLGTLGCSMESGVTLQKE